MVSFFFACLSLSIDQWRAPQAKTIHQIAGRSGQGVRE
jgi:hypothetical protein